MGGREPAGNHKLYKVNDFRRQPEDSLVGLPHTAYSLWTTDGSYIKVAYKLALKGTQRVR